MDIVIIIVVIGRVVALGSSCMIGNTEWTWGLWLMVIIGVVIAEIDIEPIDAHRWTWHRIGANEA